MRTLLQINSVANYSSTGRIAEELGQIAISKGWDSFICFGRKHLASDSKLLKIGNEWDLKLHGVQTRLFDRHGLGSINATKQLVEQIKLIKPDVIHLGNLHGYYLNIEILFKFLSQIHTPVIWTIYDCWPITGHCAYFDFIGCDKWKSECFSCPQKTNYPASYLMDRSRKNHKLKKKVFTSVKELTIISNSVWLSNIIKQSHLKNYPVHIINSGVNLDDFRPQNNYTVLDKFNLKNKFIILGVANPWSYRKGLSDFIKLRQKLDSNFQIILVGLTNYQIKSLPMNIIGIVKTESVNELAQFYSLSDVFINPTYEDNFPTTNLEALACGTPVITYNTGGSPEAITFDTGIVVEKGYVNGLVEAVWEIKSKGKKYYTDSCRKRAEVSFSKDKQNLKTFALYSEILGRQHNVNTSVT